MAETLLEDYPKPINLSQNSLAWTTAVPPPRINEIAQGKRAVTSDFDLRLTRYSCLSEGFFLRLQMD